MAKILIIDDQAWGKNLCKEELSGEGHTMSAKQLWKGCQGFSKCLKAF
ncbi:MAG: hypothetical protein QNL11_04390 [Desulfobacterales bacterium]|nr:hypothetical protein [Desulfobacterales bacterium]